MKEQQEQVQIAPFPKSHGRSFRNRTLLIGTLSFFLMAAFLFSTWNTIASVIPHIAHPTHTLSLHKQWHPQLPVLNMHLIVQAFHDEQFASQIDRLLTHKMLQKSFGGSVLIAYDHHVILSKGYSMASWSRQQ